MYMCVCVLAYICMYVHTYNLCILAYINLYVYTYIHIYSTYTHTRTIYHALSPPLLSVKHNRHQYARLPFLLFRSACIRVGVYTVGYRAHAAHAEYHGDCAVAMGPCGEAAEAGRQTAWEGRSGLIAWPGIQGCPKGWTAWGAATTWVAAGGVVERGILARSAAAEFRSSTR